MGNNIWAISDKLGPLSLYSDLGLTKWPEGLVVRTDGILWYTQIPRYQRTNSLLYRCTSDWQTAQEPGKGKHNLNTLHQIWRNFNITPIRWSFELTKYWRVPTKEVQTLPWSSSLAYPKSINLYTVCKIK